jgi:hypothetical protein
MVQTRDLEWTNGVTDTNLGPLVRRWSVASPWSGGHPRGAGQPRTGSRPRSTEEPRFAKAETFLLPLRREGPEVTFRPASYQWSPKGRRAIERLPF